MRVFIGAIVLAILSLGAVSAGGSSTNPKRGEATKPPEVQVRSAVVAVSPMIDFEEQAAIELENFYKDEQRKINEYLAWQHDQDVQAWIAAHTPPPPPPKPSGAGYHPGSTVGECTGFAIPDYIIQRESGGNPSAYNPSGAYGCAQTLLSHYSNGSCRGLDPYSIEGQRQCVLILSNGGTNLAPWAQTR